MVTRSRYLHNTQQKKETNIHTLSGIRTRDRANSDLRLRRQGHRERSAVFYGVIICQYLSVNLNGISFTIKLAVTVHVFRDFRGSYTSVLHIYYSYYVDITQTNCFYRKKGSFFCSNITERTTDTSLLIVYNTGTLRALKDNIKRRRILYAFHRSQDHDAKIYYIPDVNSIIFIVTLRS